MKVKTLRPLKDYHEGSEVDDSMEDIQTLTSWLERGVATPADKDARSLTKAMDAAPADTMVKSAKKK